VRIIGGKYRGRQIHPPTGFSSRPTTDFAKEGLFNILANRFDMEDLTALDLFGGTGSISFEFASRGAKEVHLVERDIRSVSFVRKVKKEIGAENIKPIHVDVKAFIKTCSEKYNIIFADPPYDLKWLADIPEMVLSAALLKENGVFILEHPASVNFRSEKHFTEHRNYGNVNFSFFAAEKGSV
jgi:16S rRNA (guanine(966)-N(2))-methyltransferase RsmD